MKKHITHFLLLTTLVGTALGQGSGQKYAVLIGGLGGSPENQQVFRDYLFQTRQAFVEEIGMASENVTVLGERAIAEESFVNGVATAETIREQFGQLAESVTATDDVYVVLFGHGSFDGTSAKLNIPRRDLADIDYAALLDGLAAQRIIFVNTASASGPFLDVLSHPRVITITATQTGTQRNMTRFPQYFIEALTSPAADGDKDGDLSVKEVFDYAAASTLRSYEAESHLATERPMLDDNGDGQGTRSDQLEGAADGNVAAVTFLRRQELTLAADRSDASPALRELLNQKETIERAIADIKSQKETLTEDAYYERLEEQFVRLARLNNEIDALVEG